MLSTCSRPAQAENPPRGSTVRAKITLGLLTIAALVAVVGGLGIWSGYRTAALSDDIADHLSPALRSAEQMEAQALRLFEKVDNYVRLRDSAALNNKTLRDMAYIVKDYTSAKETFLAAHDAYNEIERATRHAANPARLDTAFTRYWDVATRLINKTGPGTAANLKAELNDAEADLLEQVRYVVGQESADIIKTQGALKELSQDLRLLNLGVIAMSLALALGIAYRTSRTIVDPIVDLKAAAVRLGNGQFLSDGDPLPALTSQNEIGVLARAFTAMSDNLERLNNDLFHNANHDVLTGLANRKHLIEVLKAELQETKRQARVSALLFLDFDRFKSINDYYGHGVGDELLAAVSRRLQKTVRAADLVARLGGDEFTVLLSDIGSRAQAEDMARRLLEALRRPFELSEVELRMTASIGVVLIDASFDSALDVLRDADIAMYRAKTNGAGRFEVFSDSLREETLSVMALEADLRQALRDDALSVHYQPLVRLEDGRVVGTEALVRWQHPTRGPIFPDQFIPIAEETGLVLELDRFVMRRACAQTARWNSDLGTELSVSVNLSGQQFANHTLVDDIRSVLLETGLEPRLLHLEITETVLMQQSSLTRDILRDLKALGVGLNIDDFGTGYSSLAYLQHFDVNTLKIDRSFTDTMLESDEGATLVRTIVVMAQTLRLDIVAEGVETAAQAEYLRSLDCQYAQGYHFAKPQTAEELAAYLRDTLRTRAGDSLGTTGLANRVDV